MGHGHAVGLAQDVQRLPQVQVKILLFSQVVGIRNGSKVGSRDVPPGHGTAVGGLEHPFGLLIVEDKRLPQEVLFHRLPPFDEVAPALEGRALSGPLAHRTTQGLGKFTIGPVDGGSVVAHIAAKQLIRPLAGQHRFHIFGGQLGQKIQRHRGQIGVWLVGVVLDSRQGGEEFLFGDNAGDVF